MISVLKGNTSGCGGQSPPVGRNGGCRGLTSVFPISFCLIFHLIPSESSSSTSSFFFLKKFHKRSLKIPQNNYHSILTNYTLARLLSRSSALSINLLLIFVMHDLNGALVLSAIVAYHSRQCQDLLPLLQNYKHCYNHTNSTSV